MVSMIKVIAALALFFAAAVQTAWAGNDIYSVTYNHHIEKGETELMVMLDLTEPVERTGDTGFYMSQMLELEYGVTEQWATEFMVEGFHDLTNGTGRFTGFRWENRYRLSPKKNKGLNPVLYMEYEDLDPLTRFKMEVSGREDGGGDPSDPERSRERIMETRLILSKDIGPWNVAFNWINETDTGRSGFTEFGYALGFRRTLSEHAHEHGDEEEEESSSGLAADAGAAYQCSMHPEQKSDEPGKCPVCGMEMKLSGNGGELRHEKMEHGGNSWKPVAIGVELYGGLGNNHAFGGPIRMQQHYIQPTVMFHQRNMMIHLGAAFGLTSVSDDLIRLGMGFEL